MIKRGHFRKVKTKSGTARTISVRPSRPFRRKPARYRPKQRSIK